MDKSHKHNLRKEAHHKSVYTKLFHLRKAQKLEKDICGIRNQCNGNLWVPSAWLSTKVSSEFWHYSIFWFSVHLISSVAQSCRTLFDPMDCSMSGFPVHHQLLELVQTHVHQVCDAIQPSHPLSFTLYGLPFPSPGDLPDPGIESRSPVLQADSLPSELPGKALWKYCTIYT